MTIQDRFATPRMTLAEKLWQVNWTMVVLIAAVACIGFAMLVSAANGSYEPWASRQIIRFAGGLVVMLTVALIDIRVWLKYAYLIYALSLGLLGAVEVIGTTGMGAQRWIDLRLFHLQPSELMKVALVLALARYFHSITLIDIGRPAYLLTPLLLVAAPALLMLRQPDLGTAGMLVVGSAVLFFAAGVRIWKFVLVLVAGLASIPVTWTLLHGYQKQRILTFFDPERDPLGAGYHILQSKIALGSGHIMGKGFLAGTQSHLNFLPEKQTDSYSRCWPRSLDWLAPWVCLGSIRSSSFTDWQSPGARAASSRDCLGSRYRDILPLRLQQYRYGDWPDSSRRLAAAADILRRHGDADCPRRLWPPDER